MITYEETLTELQAIVDEFGEDYVYPREQPGFTNNYDDCVYRNTVTGEPACIVGVLLDRKGLLPENGLPAAAAGSLTIIVESFDPNAVHLLDLAQLNQDQGESWGDSVEHAEAAISSRRSYYKQVLVEV